MCWLVGCLVGHLSGWVCFALFYFLLLFSVSFLSFLFFSFFFFYLFVFPYSPARQDGGSRLDLFWLIVKRRSGPDIIPGRISIIFVTWLSLKFELYKQTNKHK